MPKSHYDPSRDTIGKIYRDLQINNKDTPVVIGDMSNEQMKGYVEDLNDALKANPYHDQPYYILFHQKKDLQMRSSILRRVIFFPNSKRPWPEDDTDCYWTDPKTQEVKFCWCLPHWSEMDNMLSNPHLYNKDMMKQIKAWKEVNLVPFGFYYKNEEEGWRPNPRWKDKDLNKPAIAS